ncbi:MAG TPA: hypothetical protein VFE62_25285, partial [Gemmataceae bacterium]|nr:hypothetical protein [Gemmataceae bacterium]
QPTPLPDIVRWTLFGIEAGVIISCMAALYLIGWRLADESIDDQMIPEPPSTSGAKIAVLVIALGAAAFLAVLSATVFLPGFAQSVGLGPRSVESEDADIDELPPEPPSAGLVPGYLLPGATKAALERVKQFHRRTLVEAYDLAGSRNSKWDEHARTAMELAARRFSDLTDMESDRAPIQAATRKALDAGCNDALMLYFHYRFASPNTADEELEAGFVKATKALCASEYPYFRRTPAFLMAEKQKLKRAGDPRVKPETLKLVNDRLHLIVLSAGEDQRCEDLEGSWFENARAAYTTYTQLGYGPRQSWRFVDQLLADEPNLEATRYHLRGWCHLQWGMEEKGRSEASDMTSSQQKLFGDYFSQGRTALEKSWQEVAQSETAAQMLWAEIQQSRSREEMEKWFERTMQHRPRLSACRAKLDWLNPKRHGTEEEVLAFGRACRDSKNWECGIPLAVVHAHQIVADAKGSESARWNYFRDPDVAADILYVFAKSLECHPDNVEMRSRYAYYCYRCGHFRRAHRQFQLLGDKLWYDTSTELLIKEARDRVAKLAA